MIISAYMVLCGSLWNHQDMSANQDLTNKVSHYIEKGWQPYGDINDMCQPMVKYSSSEDYKVIKEYLK